MRRRRRTDRGRRFRGTRLRRQAADGIAPEGRVRLPHRRRLDEALRAVTACCRVTSCSKSTARGLKRCRVRAVDGRNGAALAPPRTSSGIGTATTGPNTGGMAGRSHTGRGSTAPPRVVGGNTSALRRRAARRAVPPFNGVTLAGLMIRRTGQRCSSQPRIGDPGPGADARLEGRPCCSALAWGGAVGDLSGCRLGWRRGARSPLCSPHQITLSQRLRGAEIERHRCRRGDTAAVFQGGTAHGNGTVVTNGGRIPLRDATGPTVSDARDAPTRR